MINIDHARVSFRNYRGTRESAQRVATLTMERLERLTAADERVRGVSRTVDRAVCGPVRIAANITGEEGIAELAAARAWETIIGHI
jgi:hypothetical protein